MNLKALAIDLKRTARNPEVPIFIVGIPVLIYVIFGASAEWSDFEMKNGNYGMAIMANMAAYGAASATVSVAATAVLERLQGWGRQLALTPMGMRSYFMSKTVTAMLLALLPIIAVYLIAFIARADGTLGAWGLSFLFVFLGSIVFAAFGLGVSLSLKSPIAGSIAPSMMTVFGFFSNMFFPLDGTLLAISKFTPMYGYGVIVRYPITEGTQFRMTGYEPYQESLTWAIGNFAVWTVIMVAFAMWGLKRSQSRG